MRQAYGWTGGLLAALLLVGTSGCVTVAEHRKLEKRIVAIERGTDVRGVSEQEERDRVAELGAEVERLENEVERLTGRLDVAEYNVKQALDEAKAARADAAAAATAVPAGSGDPDASPQGRTSTAPRPRSSTPTASPAPPGAMATPMPALTGFGTSSRLTRPPPTPRTLPTGWPTATSSAGTSRRQCCASTTVVARYPSGKRAPDALYRQGEALLKLWVRATERRRARPSNA